PDYMFLVLLGKLSESEPYRHSEFRPGLPPDLLEERRSGYFIEWIPWLHLCFEVTLRELRKAFERRPTAHQHHLRNGLIVFFLESEKRGVRLREDVVEDETDDLRHFLVFAGCSHLPFHHLCLLDRDAER